jgi:hypothetical protein
VGAAGANLSGTLGLGRGFIRWSAMLEKAPMDDGILGWIVFTVGIVLAGIGVFALILSPLLVLVIAAGAGLAIWITGAFADRRRLT